MPDKQHTSETVLIKKDEHEIGHITINRPKAYNALSIECMEALIRALDILSADSSVRVIILAGSGKGFCAGHDLKELRSCTEKTFHKKIFDLCTRLMLSITRSPKPVIAKVHGIATAAGCQLVASCDLAVAEKNAGFATPGVTIGLFCSTPMVALSRNISKKHAMEMLLSGDLISAQRAYETGLINRLVPIEQLDQATLDLAKKIASKSPLALKIGKRAFYEQLDRNEEDAYRYCSQVMVENLTSRDAKEGIDAVLEKRSPVWCGE
ncbi:MAG: enoyl-CoA hydratase [Chlorobium phaeobacteroides]|uniref:Enoyl-CoA hydratase domain-containing protein 3, mitochondrial n=1 Tax=Chlorobium phaeobacteroides (strain BS1) TaxID=331678 RepID=B3EN31_CHLPB|nr:enoyl-CoA hydratase [Chlorobium phaeobacteroides]MBL6957244.1 enoyl-CoA hydratase [Chlorobium phaeobacteroides]